MAPKKAVEQCPKKAGVLASAVAESPKKKGSQGALAVLNAPEEEGDVDTPVVVAAQGSAKKAAGAKAAKKKSKAKAKPVSVRPAGSRWCEFQAEGPVDTSVAETDAGGGGRAA